MTPDDLLYLRMQIDDLHKRPPLGWLGFILVTSSTPIWVMIHPASSIFACIVTLIYGLWLIKVALKNRRLMNRYDDEISLRLESIALSKRINAVNMYGYMGGIYAVIECEESHFPGDCPLCGAE